MSISIAQLIGGGGIAQGATKTTAGRPLYDGDLDRFDNSIGSTSRKQLKYLNVNTTDIPTMVSSATANCVGISLNVQVETRHKTFNEQAEALIVEHSKLGVGELTNTHHFNSSVRAISDFDLLNGGILIVHHYNTAWKIPYKYELVSIDMIDVSKGSHTFYDSNSESTVNGIVRNKWGQKTHLWLYEDEKRQRSKKVSIENITYYSDVWISIDQQVAVSRLVSLLPTLDRVDQYAKAELENAIESAKAGAFLKSTAYDEIMRIAFEELNKLNNFDQQVVQIKGILQDLAKVGIGNYGLSPIPAGDSVEFNPNKRDGVFKELSDNSEMKMSSSIGMSALGVYSKADRVNYSAMKYVSETDSLSASIRFDNISNKILNNIIDRLIRVGVQTGRITDRAKYWSNPSEFSNYRYLRRRKIDIEPAKTAQANATNIELGLKTKAQIIEEAEGVKYETFLRRQIEQEVFEIKLRKEIYERNDIDINEAPISSGVNIPEKDDKTKEEDS